MWITLVPLLFPPVPPQDDAGTVPTPLEHFEARERSMELMRQGAAEAALPLLLELTETTPHDGEAWLLLARCHYRLGSYDFAIAAYEEALALGFGNAPSIHYDIACCNALMNYADEAFAALERALASRFEDRSQLLGDTDLNALHDDPRWSKAAGLLRENDLSPAEGWRHDLLFLKKEMARLHMDVGQAAPQAEVDAAIADLYERIPELPEHRIPVQMQRIVRLLDDGHSVVFPLSRRVRPTMLPFRFYWFPEGLFVIHARPGFEEWIGARVVSIGSGAADRFSADLRALVTRDNPMGLLWMGPFYLLFPAILHDLGYVDSIERIPMMLERPDGESHEFVVEPVPLELFQQKLMPSKLASETPLYLRNVEDGYWYEVLDEGVLYVQFNQVADKPTETVAAFAKRIRDAVTADEIDRLIVDVRHNNGGVSYLSTELVRSLVHFETTRRGRLYVLIGRNTYSAAQIFITDVERWTDAIFVGEPSGSRPNMVSEESQVVLPFSGTQASISCRYFQQSWPGDERIWITPDIPVTLTAVDYHAGRDPALEIVLEHIRR